MAANVVDILVEEIEKGADKVNRMSQEQFLSSYVDVFNKNLLVVPKVPMMSYALPVSQTLSRPGSAKRAQSRPNSGTTKIDFNTLKPSPATANDECILIIIDIQCADAIEAIVHLLQRKTSVSAHRAKIIVLSTLLTWSAKRYPKGIAEADLEFPNRVPVSSAMGAYSSENSLSRLNNGVFLKHGGRGVVLLGIGLLYGLDGLTSKTPYGPCGSGPIRNRWMSTRPSSPACSPTRATYRCCTSTSWPGNWPGWRVWPWRTGRSPQASNRRSTPVRWAARTFSWPCTADSTARRPPLNCSLKWVN